MINSQFKRLSSYFGKPWITEVVSESLFEHPKCHIWGLASPKLTVALWANIFMGVFFTDTTGFKIVVILNAMIFAFTTFVKNTPLWVKNASRVWKKNIFQISHLTFGMLQAAKYPIYDSTFTFPFFIMYFRLSWPFFIYLEYLHAKKMTDKVEISIWNIWM